MTFVALENIGLRWSNKLEEMMMLVLLLLLLRGEIVHDS